MSEIVYIYTLTHPTTNEIRYIGKANDIQKRLKGHLSDCNTRTTPVYCWMKKLKSQGLIPNISIIKETDSSNWMDAEKQAIKEYRKRGHRLLNLAEGGNEPFCSKETRAENGRMVSHSVHSDEKRKRFWSLKQQLAQDLRYLEKKGDDRQKSRCGEIRQKLATRGIYLK